MCVRTILEFSDLRAAWSSAVHAGTPDATRLTKGGHDALHLLGQLSGGGHHQHLEWRTGHSESSSTHTHTSSISHSCDRFY